ncbi:methionyl-tRNA formyltransferase [Leptolyngbya sp. FACHB-321]|uniref:methionyl-tRNA formyltransferase n=1 Tax=Leptolyngbya sp. FACHB-321 TaxID=2692807 RepID=UPI0016866E00|nr:methionyl-tRNA formyltransferase [Leptolyngbya sp. FACHB-321]MBD2038057.1 methionyl-tRNA formyltransferase [Leptolyngbya sp. FACHB-321]
MNIIFFGTPDFAVPSLERLLSHPAFNVLAVVTQPDKRRGRGSQLIPSPVKAIAQSHNLPLYQPKSVKKDEATLDYLKNAQADAFVVVAYGQILSQAILDLPRLGCVNAHGSILPRYRGAAPIQWSLYHGEAETGITTMLMDAGMDTGPMLLEARTPIALLDNFEDLATRLAHIGADLLPETLLQLDQRAIQPMTQDESQATYAPLIKKDNYWLDWSRSAIALHNQIRGFFPSCSATFRDEAIKIVATAPLSEAFETQLPSQLSAIAQAWSNPSEAAQPGEVVGILKGEGAIVQTGDGVLLLRTVQLPGKRPQSGWDFANGTRLAVGEVFEKGG